MIATSPNISIQGLTKRIGSRQILNNVSLTAEPGQITGLLGPNGCGKSTTLRCLLGLYHYDSGKVLIGDKRYVALPHSTQTVGAVLEPATMDPSMSGYNHLHVYAKMGGHPKARVDKCIDLLSMHNYAHQATATYSTGMRQRLAIATALLGNPRVIILDEPTNGLDPEGIEWLKEFLIHLRRDARTVLISSHVLAEIEEILDAAVILKNGSTVTSGTIKELSEHWGHQRLNDIYRAALRN